jgi:hypothetical protein
MQLDRIILACPYLIGSPEGIMCNVSSDFIRNIGDIDLGICMSKHYESCFIYIEKLIEESSIQASLNIEDKVA